MHRCWPCSTFCRHPQNAEGFAISAGKSAGFAGLHSARLALWVMVNISPRSYPDISPAITDILSAVGEKISSPRHGMPGRVALLGILRKLRRLRYFYRSLFAWCKIHRAEHKMHPDLGVYISRQVNAVYQLFSPPPPYTAPAVNRLKAFTNLTILPTIALVS